MSQGPARYPIFLVKGENGLEMFDRRFVAAPIGLQRSKGVERWFPVGVERQRLSQMGFGFALFAPTGQQFAQVGQTFDVVWLFFEQ